MTPTWLPTTTVCSTTGSMPAMEGLSTTTTTTGHWWAIRMPLSGIAVSAPMPVATMLVRPVPTARPPRIACLIYRRVQRRHQSPMACIMPSRPLRVGRRTTTITMWCCVSECRKTKAMVAMCRMYWWCVWAIISRPTSSITVRILAKRYTAWWVWLPIRPPMCQRSIVCSPD